MKLPLPAQTAQELGAWVFLNMGKKMGLKVQELVKSLFQFRDLHPFYHFSLSFLLVEVWDLVSRKNIIDQDRWKRGDQSENLHIEWEESPFLHHIAARMLPDRNFLLQEGDGKQFPRESDWLKNKKQLPLVVHQEKKLCQIILERSPVFRATKWYFLSLVFKY